MPYHTPPFTNLYCLERYSCDIHVRSVSTKQFFLCLVNFTVEGTHLAFFCFLFEVAFIFELLSKKMVRQGLACNLMIGGETVEEKKRRLHNSNHLQKKVSYIDFQAFYSNESLNSLTTCCYL